MTPDERRHHAEATLNAISDAVLATDLGGHITYLNIAAGALTGWSIEEALGRPVGEVVKTIGDGAECVLIGRDGRETEIEHSTATIVDADGVDRGAVLVFRNVGAAREAARRLSHQVAHDALTGLPNRVLLTDRLTAAIALAERHKKPLAVLFLDLDGFKAVNDTLGHAAGDALLKSVAARLTAALRRSDTVSRHSGDEFVVVLPEIEHAEDAALVAKKLVKAASGPHRIDTRNVTVTTSVGIALYPDDGRTAEALIRHADAAMYHAKRTGNGSFRLFTPDLLTATDLVSSAPTRATSVVAHRRRNWSQRALPLFELLEDQYSSTTGRHERTRQH